MKVFDGAKFILSSRGLGRIVPRLGTILKRFGFSSARQIGYVRHYADLVAQWGGKVTFFIPSSILERHAKALKSVNNACVEWGVHGHVHTDMSRFGFEQQICYISTSIKIFDKAGIPFKGFRAPYLRANPAVMEALVRTGRFVYDSSASFWWEDGQEFSEAEVWAKRFYKSGRHVPGSANVVHNGSLTEIPVALPDDDILVDRMGMGATEALVVWKKMLLQCHRNDDVFVLQLHPERIYDLEMALVGLMETAKALQPQVRIAALSDLVKPGSGPMPSEQTRGTLCITGDIDALNISDFLLRLREW